MSKATRTDTQSRALHVADSHDLIRVQGARENNLKDPGVMLPKHPRHRHQRPSPPRRTHRCTDNGVTRRLTADYLNASHVGHGYAITVHKAHGLTADPSFVLGTDHLYRELSYVALSRGRVRNEIHLTAPQLRLDAHGLETGVAPTR